MMEAKDEKELGFDRDGNYIGLIPDDKRTHYDVMHYKYKQCAKCHKWFKEDEYPLKSDGTPTKCCENCLDTMKKAQEARKAKKEAKKVSKDAVGHSKIDLSQVPPQDLIQEMQRRGWKGNVQVVMNFEL